MFFNNENSNTKKLIISLTSIALISFGIGSIIMLSSNSPFNSNATSNSISNLVTNTSSPTVITNKKENISDSSFIDKNINEEKILALNNTKEIFVDCSIGKINIIPEERSDVKVTFKGTVALPLSLEVPKLETFIEGTTMNIKAKTKHEISFTLENRPKKLDLFLDVYVPSSYCENLKLCSSMGDIKINKFNLKDFTCKLSMGNTIMSNIKADNFDYTNSMGNFDCDSLFTKSSKINCSMGYIKLKNFTGDLVSKNSMGNTDITYYQFNNKVDLDASMGTISLKLPETSEFYLSAKCGMGNVKCDFPITVSEKQKNSSVIGTVKSDKNKVTINNSMGEIKILQ